MKSHLITTQNVKGKKVLVRAPFDLPMNKGKITNDSRLRSAIPTFRYLLDGGAAIVVISKNGRPAGKKVKSLSLAPIAKHLGKILDKKVKFLPCIDGPRVEKAKKNLKPGEILVLENLRFWKEEEANDEKFAKALAKDMDIFVFEDFPNAGNNHAGTTGVGKFLPTYAGIQFAKEVETLSKIFKNPKPPFVAVVGGAKISTKIDIIKKLIPKIDVLIVGGGMANTMLVAEGYDIGKSLYEEDYLDTAEEISRLSDENGVELLLPDDVIVSKKIGDKVKVQEKAIDEVNKNEIIIDIGSKSISKFAEPLKFAGTIFWNGPLGITEYKSSRKGTDAVAHIIAENQGDSIIGGGDTVASVDVKLKFNFVSSGGGSTLQFIAGNKLPVVEMFKDSKL